MPADVNGITLTGGTTFSMASGATTLMGVNASGIITRPQTPYVRMQTSGQPTYYSADPMVFGSVDQQVGSNWNNSTGLWTCPVAGYYLVLMNFIGANYNGGSYGYPYIYKNGATYVYSHWNVASGWDSSSLSTVIQCAANDTIKFAVFPAGSSGNGVYGPGNHCHYSIALLG